MSERLDYCNGGKGCSFCTGHNCTCLCHRSVTFTGDHHVILDGEEVPFPGEEDGRAR